ncbi:MAG: glycosyltransferase family protein [Pseudomonadota bacterium]
MTRIVYGVSGEGSGHSSRAREMLEHLLSLGHDVRVVSYDRGVRNLSPDFDVHAITGLHIVSVNNKLSATATVARNVRACRRLYRSWRSVCGLMEAFAPHAVITDFEPMTAYAARRSGVPLVTIDNQHRMRFMSYPPVPAARWDGFVTRSVIRAMVPQPAASLISTFYRGEVTDPRAELYSPILRQVVRDLTPTTGDHVLVYATQAFDGLVDVLRTCAGQVFRVYGFDRDDREGHIVFRPFSVDGFLADLASSRGVVATAGFTLMTEALHLGKPMLALPMSGQYEQRLNAHLLETMGLGAMAPLVTRQALEQFVAGINRYTAALRAYPRDDGGPIKARLAALLADNARALGPAPSSAGGV